MTAPAIISLIIPAYNEQEAVASTLRRSVEAFKHNLDKHGIDQIEVILVSDGSSDETLARAREVSGIRVVSYNKNRGYGKAIETGYAAAKGNYLAFMDSDGTCDPAFIFDLWNHMQQTNSDIVLGCRMHNDSKMPGIRRVGNTCYAWLLSAISGKIIRDTASGMRLLKRDLLSRILPLPSGLHYTPAMSTRCVMDPQIKISEITMPYQERTGTSKLHVWRDGLIFLQTILTTALFYSPLRIIGSIGIIGFIAGLLVAPWVGFETMLASWGIPWMVITTAIGLMFHFFSKLILPHWPSNFVELVLDRLLHPVLLVVIGILLAVVSFLPGIPQQWNTSVWLMSASSFFLGGGRFILHQAKVWGNRELPVEELLKDTTIVDTPPA